MTREDELIKRVEQGDEKAAEELVELYYAPLLRGVREAFADPNTGFAPSLTELDPAEVGSYYDACDARIISLMKQEQRAHPHAQKAAVKIYSQVEKPFLFFPG